MKLVFTILALAALGGVVYFISTENQAVPVSPPITEQGMTETGESASNTYRHTDGVYSFAYPDDYTLDTQDPTYIRIYKQGEQQRPQSEMSDGVLVVFESVDLAGQTLDQVVDARIQQSTADGTSRLVQPKQAVVINGFPGFSYAIEGLGTANYIVLQKNAESDSAVSITYLVADPQQLGYQAELDAILSTVELHN